jgi:hypothetical protein
MPAKKKTSLQAAPFLTTAAEAIGTALGKLAVKTGVATPTSSTKRKKAPVATKKKVTSPGKKAVRKSTR